MLFARIALTAGLIINQGCERSAEPSGQSPESVSAFAAAVPPDSPSETETPAVRGYDNGINRLVEQRIAVTDQNRKPAVLALPKVPIGDVDLEIVWTYTTDWRWNYCLPQFPGGKEAFAEEYPSEHRFLERKLEAKTILQVEIPETPYWFYILNGEVSPYFYDSKKSVIWHLSGAELEQAFHGQQWISASAKTLKLTAGGGDMAAYLIIDFTDPQASPRVTYYVEYHGF